MDFYPTLFGHAEVRVDRRDPRPRHLTDEPGERGPRQPTRPRRKR